MLAPICGMCGFSLTKVKSGVVVAEMYSPNLVDETPYRLWMADRFQCETPECDFTGFVVADFAQSPLASNFDDNFDDQLKTHPPEMIWHERRGR